MPKLADPNAGESERSVGTSVRPIKESQSRGDCLMMMTGVVRRGRQMVTVMSRISARICPAGCLNEMRTSHQPRLPVSMMTCLTRHRPRKNALSKRHNILARRTLAAVPEVCSSENRGFVQWMTVNGSKSSPLQFQRAISHTPRFLQWLYRE